MNTSEKMIHRQNQPVGPHVFFLHCQIKMKSLLSVKAQL